MILTHPEFSRTKIPANVQRELAELGVYIEKCWYNIGEGECAAQEMADHIRTVGASRCYMTTDRGQAGREHPAKAMGRFLDALSAQRIGRGALYAMTHILPKEILG